MKCKIRNCNKRRLGKKELCSTHNSRLERHGDVYADIPIGRGYSLWMKRELLKHPASYRCCPYCKKFKSSEDFYKKNNKKGGSQGGPYCKSCKRDRSLQKRYHITSKDYDKILKKQKNRCTLCGTKKSGANGKSFSVDHNHKTGTIRGLLCINCNRYVGTLDSKINSKDLFMRNIPKGNLKQYLKKDIVKLLGLNYV